MDGDLAESIKHSASDRQGDFVPATGSSPDFSKVFSQHDASSPLEKFCPCITVVPRPTFHLSQLCYLFEYVWRGLASKECACQGL